MYRQIVKTELHVNGEVKPVGTILTDEEYAALSDLVRENCVTQVAAAAFAHLDPPAPVAAPVSASPPLRVVRDVPPAE